MTVGFVTGFIEKPWNGKNFYSLKLDDGNLYGFGTYRPAADVGDKVSFDATRKPNGYYEAIKGTLKIEKVPEGSAQNVPAAVVAGKSKGSDEFWSNKEKREVKNDELRQLGASRNTAIEWIKVKLQAEALKLPAKAADKEKALDALLQETVDLFMGKVKETGTVVATSKTVEIPAEDVSEEAPPWE